MNENKREEIALFRYGLIAPLLNGQVDPKQYLSEVSTKKHIVPYRGEQEFSSKTITSWLSIYRHEGFEGLKPKRRSDRGQSRSLSTDQQDHILSLRRDMNTMAVSVFYDQLITKGEILPHEVSYSTVYRLLTQHGLLSKEIQKAPGRKRFAYETVNTLWQSDVSDGPYLNTGRKKIKTYLFACIDDCSRLIPFAQFFPSEKLDGLCTILKEAFTRRGIPKMFYTDNGKIFRSDILRYACAGLGIALIHTAPYDPASKGKIERWFRTVQTRFYPLLQIQSASSLEELNRRFWQWLEEDYHRKSHSSLDGKTPLNVYLSQVSRIRLVEDPIILDPLFLKREHRKVRHDGTISLHTKLYEVPERFIGQQVEIRFDENKVYIYEEGKAVSQVFPVSLHDNAHIKRQRSAISFKDMSASQEKPHV
jgi:transposase InsO family protein